MDNSVIFCIVKPRHYGVVLLYKETRARKVARGNFFQIVDRSIQAVV